MMRPACLIFFFLLSQIAFSAAKPHTITFGKWTTVEWFVGHDEAQSIGLKIRPLYVDSHLKEYTFGAPHEITDRLFVVRRAFRLNDTLPADKIPRWRWERGGWLLVDRAAAHITTISLPEFDVYYSVASWYRDY